MLKIQNVLLEENLCNHLLFFDETDISFQHHASVKDWLNEQRISTPTQRLRIRFGSKHRKIHFKKNPMFWSQSPRKIEIAWPNPLI